MNTYRVKIGYTFGGITLLSGGSLVELTDEEARGFLDKLELVEGGDLPDQQSGDTLTVSTEEPAKRGKAKGS